VSRARRNTLVAASDPGPFEAPEQVDPVRKSFDALRQVLEGGRTYFTGRRMRALFSQDIARQSPDQTLK